MEALIVQEHQIANVQENEHDSHGGLRKRVRTNV